MSLENYEPVAVRLHRLLTGLREQNEQPRVITVMLSEPGADICVFRAELWLGDALMATGHAEEVRGQGTVNARSHLENCETSALGRMAESYSPNPDWTKRPSQEEMGKVYVVNNSTTSNGHANTTVRGPLVGLASEKQIGYIKGACKRDGHPSPVGVDGFTKQEASNWIEAHKNGTNAGDIPNPHMAHPGEEEPF